MADAQLGVAKIGVTKIGMKRIGMGIDIGGSGIKGAPVDLETGQLTRDRIKIATPSPSTPEAVAEVVRLVADGFDELPPSAPVGVTIPGVVQHGVVRTAANIDKQWIGFDAQSLFTTAIGRPCFLVNDADAAGVAEARFGAAEGQRGLVVVTTLGTGIGTALIYNGSLIPNAELGHIEVDGFDAETKAAASAREREGLTYPQWAKRLQRYFTALEDLLWPDLFVVGGGVSRKSEKFLPLLKLRTPIVPAATRNGAGIAGAAVLAAEPTTAPW